VTSTRGASGGYLLARATDEISLLDIYLAIEGPVECPATVTAGLAPKSRNATVLKHAWESACQAGAGTLASQTLADLVARSVNTVEPMYFI
jgi:Rrf2 family protein